MTTFNINQGDLLAHLDGQTQPHLDVALRNQPELRTELETLREADQFFHQKFGRTLRPDSQDLVDVVTGQASPAQKLRVMAFVRQSPAGDAEMAALREAFADAQEEELGFIEGKKRQGILETIGTALRQFIAQPLQATGVRGNSLYSEETQNTFYVAKLDARVTVYPSPPIGEEWIIEGYVTQREEPIDGISATLEQNDEIVASTESEEGGFFTFEAIEAGCYQIKVHFEHGTLIIPKIELEDE